MVDTVRRCGYRLRSAMARYLLPQGDHAASNWLLATLSAREGMACLGSLTVCALMLAAERSFSCRLRTLDADALSLLARVHVTTKRCASSTTPFTSIPEMATAVAAVAVSLFPRTTSSSAAAHTFRMKTRSRPRGTSRRSRGEQPVLTCSSWRQSPMRRRTQG